MTAQTQNPLWTDGYIGPPATGESILNERGANMSECIICGAAANVARGGALLCAEHYGEATQLPERTDVFRWAMRKRSALRTALPVKLSPQARAALDSLAKVSCRSRTAVIEELILRVDSLVEKANDV